MAQSGLTHRLPRPYRAANKKRMHDMLVFTLLARLARCDAQHSTPRSVPTLCSHARASLPFQTKTKTKPLLRSNLPALDSIVAALSGRRSSSSPAPQRDDSQTDGQADSQSDTHT